MQKIFVNFYIHVKISKNKSIFSPKILIFIKFCKIFTYVKFVS